MKLQKTTSIKSPVRLLSVVFNNHLSFFPRKKNKRRASSPAGKKCQTPFAALSNIVGLAPHPLLRRPFLGSSLHLKKNRSNEGKSGSLDGFGEMRFLQT